MRPILSATNTYNFKLSKWLEDKLKPLSTNQYTINDINKFAEELQEIDIDANDILVSYDVSSLFTNVPLEDTIQILADKAFTNNWFNSTHNLNISRSDLVDLLRAATKDQLFQFNGALYEQIDGVAMGSPLGPLMANTFMCYIEENLQAQHQVPSLYRRYVDDTLAAVPSLEAAESFLETLNQVHPAIKFTIELPNNNVLPYLGMEIHKYGSKLETKVYVKPTDTGLLLHYHLASFASYSFLLDCL